MELTVNIGKNATTKTQNSGYTHKDSANRPALIQF